MKPSSCRICTLAAIHPMAHLDAGGVCAPCRREESEEGRAGRRRVLESRMEELFEKVRARGGTRVLMALSGGKDSCWTLLQLRRRFGLQVRALTLDNGFLSEIAQANAAAVTSALDVEHVVVRPRMETLRALFTAALEDRLYPPTALTRASSVCNACIAIVKSACLREALGKGMDVAVWGWSPGQAPLSSALFRPTRALISQMLEGWQRPVQSALGSAANEFLFDLDADFPDATLPYFVSPLALWACPEEQMVEELGALGWQTPGDVDANSTNCRLNGLACHEHRLRHGFHPYALEIAGLVREGLLDREEARERLAQQEEPAVLHALADELQLEAPLREELGILALE